MHRQKDKTGLRVGLILLAACLAGVITVQGTEKSAQSRDLPGVAAKKGKLQKQQKSKDRESKAANTKKKLAHTRGQSRTQASAESAKEIAQLKQQLALQQKQIAQLLHAVNKLQAEVAAKPKPEIAASAAAEVNNGPRPAAPASAAQPSGNNEIASLTPILPPQPKAGSADANQVLAANTPVNLPQAKQSVAAGLRSAGSPHSAVTGSESSPAHRARSAPPLELAHGKVKIGATFFGLYRYYFKTGFGPQILTLLNTPGPGNNGFNSFDVDRTYINFLYTPTDAITFRVTPNIYRQYGGASAVKLSNTSATGSTVNGNLVLRLKYAYMDFNKPFAHSKAFGKDKVTFGQTQQPLTDWEEGLYGYRFVNLTPWNYLSLSSTYPGLKLHGPIMIHGKQYLDYDVGVFNNQSFHAYETGEKKQAMMRLSYYPFGAVSKYQGFGLTGFVDYGYKDAAPDLNINVPITRVAALAHYTTKSNDYGIAFEYDYGRNAFSSGHQFSGSAPADEYGLGPTPFANMDALAKALLNVNGAKQQGFDFFGHARIAKSPFYLFGMFEQFNPNTNVSNNPFDFRTVVGGISYKYGKYWQFALDSQNILYYHSQFTFPAAELASYNPGLAASNPNGIPNAVPSDTNAIFFNVLFNY
ncbi:MAG: hypothetical protein P8Z30_05500 [Acidobacteriota bacterium]